MPLQPAQKRVFFPEVKHLTHLCQSYGNSSLFALLCFQKPNILLLRILYYPKSFDILNAQLICYCKKHKIWPEKKKTVKKFKVLD